MSTNDLLSVPALDDFAWSQDLDPENPMHFLHGEQGALICTAKIVQQVPATDANLFAATQVMDEARHAEVYPRPLRADAALPHEPFQPHRALDRTDRCLGRAHPRRPADQWRSRHRAGRGERNRTAR